jgi:chromosome segregation ATPase
MSEKERMLRHIPSPNERAAQLDFEISEAEKSLADLHRYRDVIDETRMPGFQAEMEDLNTRIERAYHRLESMKEERARLKGRVAPN